MMKKFMKKLWEKKDSKKGFTLVELIVVLVILAILAAIMVPALLGWIDKAKDKQIILEARTAYLAAQSLASEEYGRKEPDIKNVTEEEIAKLAGLPEKSVTGVTWDTTNGFVVATLTYVSGDKEVVYTASTGEYKVSDKPAPTT